MYKTTKNHPPPFPTPFLPRFSKAFFGSLEYFTNGKVWGFFFLKKWEGFVSFLM